MSSTCGQNSNITSGQLERLALRSAKLNLRFTAYDDEYLVGGRVVVVVGIDAVTPQPDPAVLSQQSFNVLNVL